MQLASLRSLQWWTFSGQLHRHRFELISTKKWCCMVFTIWVVGCCPVSVPTWWCHSVLLAEPLELTVNSFRFCCWSFLVWFLWVATMWWQYYPNFYLARFSYGWVQNSWHFGCGTLCAFCELMSIALCGPWFLWNSADEGSSFLLSITVPGGLANWQIMTVTRELNGLLSFFHSFYYFYKEALHGFSLRYVILGTAPMMLFGFISVAGIVQAQLATIPVIGSRQTLGKLRSPRLHTTCDREYLNRVGSQVTSASPCQHNLCPLEGSLLTNQSKEM